MVTGPLTSPGRSLRLATPAPYVLSTALAIVTIAGAAATFFIDGVLRGTAAMNGSARGTALVMLVVATPVLLVSMVLYRRGSDRAVFGWLGATGYLIYNGLLLLLATPFNQLFLLYIAGLALGLATVAVVVAQLDLPDWQRASLLGLPYVESPSTYG